MTSPHKPKTVSIPTTNTELHAALKALIASRTMGRAVSELLLQSLWLHKCQDKARQVTFATELRRFLDSWTAGVRDDG